MNKLDNQTFYDQDAARYDTRWVTTGGSTTEATQRTIVAQLCRPWAGRTVVEIGCGTGRFSLILAQLGAQVTLVDLSSHMLKVAAAKLATHGVAQNVRGYVNASIYDLPFPANSVDCVISLNVFNHLEQIERALAQCGRVLKQDGLFLFNYPNLYSYFWPMALRINQRAKALGQEVFSQWLNPVTVAQELAAAGFAIETKVGHVHVPRALEPFHLTTILAGLDRISRRQPLQPLAPVHFCLCRKVQ